MLLKQCGNVTKLLKIYETDKYLNLLLDYHDGGTLGNLLEKQTVISEADARMIIAQILLTVDFMCRKGMIHRDLKPENILIESLAGGGRSYDIRIADFGYAVFEESLKPSDNDFICGTPGFIAPEAIEGKGYT